MGNREDFRLKAAAKAGKQLSDPLWRLRSGKLYWIIDKEGHEVRFIPNWSQDKLLDEMWYFDLILKARQIGFCVDPSTRVLTADLRWVCIADLAEGDEIISVIAVRPVVISWAVVMRPQ